MTKHRIPFYISFLLLILSCKTKQPQKCDFNDFVELTSKVKTLEYRHIKIFDNKFNSTVYYDTSDVTIFHLEEEKLGFQIIKKDYEWFYDSNELVELNHTNKTKSIEEIDDISESSLWDKNLLSMVDTLSGKDCETKSINNVLYQHFSNKYYSTSKVDSTEILITEFAYTFPKTNFNSFLHKQIIIKAKDTLQIQNHILKNISSQSLKSYDTVKKRIKNTLYQLTEENPDLPFGKEPVSEGDELKKIEFNDIENNSIQIINDNQEYSLIIFSFIGCTPCEIALNQLEEDKLGLKTKVNLYYSSFQNNNSAIKKYLKNKNIFQNAFAMESNMIDEFRLPVAPTFVLIDSNREIIKIIEGFDNSVLRDLNRLVTPLRN